MPIPPCEGSVREGAGNKFYFASFWVGANLEDTLRFLYPLQYINNSTVVVKGFGFAVGEVFV